MLGEHSSCNACTNIRQACIFGTKRLNEKVPRGKNRKEESSKPIAGPSKRTTRQTTALSKLSTANVDTKDDLEENEFGGVQIPGMAELFADE